MSTSKIYWLRLIHGFLVFYFTVCLFYIYYAAITLQIDFFLLAAIASLCIEGFAVFVLNKGDCPLIHVQRKLGDNKSFFELFLPPSLAKRAIPTFAALAWLAAALLSLRLMAAI